MDKRFLFSFKDKFPKTNQPKEVSIAIDSSMLPFLTSPFIIVAKTAAPNKISILPFCQYLGSNNSKPLKFKRFYYSENYNLIFDEKSESNLGVNTIWANFLQVKLLLTPISEIDKLTEL